MMQFGSQTPDKALQKTVDRKLLQKCSGSTHISATVRSGSATVTGTIKHEHERKPIMRCVAAVQGIQRVIDQLRLEVKKNPTA